MSEHDHDPAQEYTYILYLVGKASFFLFHTVPIPFYATNNGYTN